MARSTLWKHHKFRALERALGSRCLAAGVLECMWSYGYETAEDLLGKSAEEVEECCGWSGKGFKRGRCFSALLEIGWIDSTPEGYRIHGLFEHCPQYVKRRRERHLSSQKLAKSYSQVSTPYPTTTTTTSPRPVAPTGASPSDDIKPQEFHDIIKTITNSTSMPTDENVDARRELLAAQARAITAGVLP